MLLPTANSPGALWGRVPRSPSSQLRSRVEWVGRVSRLVRFAASVPSFDDFARRAAADPFLLSSEFADFVLDLLKQQGLAPTSYSDNIEEWNARYIQVRQILHLHTVMEAGEGPELPEEVHPALAIAKAANHHTPLAVETSTLDYVYALLRLYSRPGNVRTDQGEQMALDLETLETIAFNAQQVRSERGVERIRNSGLAAYWYADMLPGPIVHAMIEAIRSAKLTLDEAIGQIQNSALRALENKFPTQHDRSFYHANVAGAFCVMSSAAMGDVGHTQSCLVAFRALLDTPGVTKLSPDHRASLVWRYTSFVFQHMATAGDLKSTLEDCESLLSTHTPLVSKLDHPGLIRDLTLAHARVLVELSIWGEESTLTQAVALFERGASVPWAQYDREARGQALSDLAGALRRAHAGAGISDAVDERILSLYNQAGFFLSATSFPLARLTMLMNLAIYYNERRHGTYSTNQERALATIDEALALARSLPRNQDSPAFTHVEQVRASAWQTHANIIRMRNHGHKMSVGTEIMASASPLPAGLSQWATAALRSYQEGLRILESASILVPLRGQLHLNMAGTLVEDMRVAYSEDKAVLADTHLRNARELLGGIAHLEARVTLEETELELLADLSHSRAQLSTNIKRACRSAVRVARSGHIETAIGTSLFVAASALKKGRAHDVETAEACLKELLEFAGSWPSLSPECSADLLTQLARICVSRATRSDNEVHHLERALALTDDALTRLHRTLEAQVFVGDALRTSGGLASLAADIAWLHLRLAELTSAEVDAGRLDKLLSLAAGGEAMPDDPGSFSLGATRSSMLGAEAQVWAQGDQALVDQDILDEFDAFHAARVQYELERELLSITGQPADEGNLADERASFETALQLLVSEWGSYAVVFESGSLSQTISLAVDRRDIRRWLHGDATSRGWLFHYSKRHDSEAGWTEWVESNRRLGSMIGDAIWEPLSQAEFLLEGVDLAVIPGALAGLPLHAGQLRDGRHVIELLSGFAYTKDRTRGPTPTFERALFALSDPKHEKGQKLAQAPCEVATLAQICVDGGARVDLLLDSWGETTPDVFTGAGCPLPTAANLVGRPTPDELIARIPDVDLFVYSGHGAGIGNIGGSLLLSDSSGARTSTSIVSMMRLQRLRRRPGVILSACETAWEAVSPSRGSSSVASTFLALGASSILGSLWKIPDAEARYVSCSYTTKLMSGHPPSQALVETIRSLIRDKKPAARWSAYCLWLG